MRPEVDGEEETGAPDAADRGGEQRAGRAVGTAAGSPVAGSVAGRLETLEARGVARFDPVGVELVATLLARAVRLRGVAGSSGGAAGALPEAADDPPQVAGALPGAAGALRGAAGAVPGAEGAEPDAAGARPGAEAVLSPAAGVLLGAEDTAGGGAAAHLERRAAWHLDRLEAAHTAARQRAEEALSGLDGRGVAVPAEAREALEAGDPVPVLRAARRLAVAGAQPLVHRAAPERRYRDALADLETALASRSAPAGGHTGLLDGRTLAARILEEAEALAPAWRRSLVATLVDLAALLHLPEPPRPRRAR